MNLLVTGARVLVEKRLGGKDDAIQTETALSGLLVDERLLERMRRLRRAQAFKRDDLRAGHGAHARDAGSDRLAVGDDGAGTALSLAAPELRPTELQVVAQDLQQRRRGIDIHALRTPVDSQVKMAMKGAYNRLRSPRS